jgi:predicted NUDIX family NTP pyrophosphohydrolase
MPRLSAGVLLYRSRNGELEVFLVHPGGPFWKAKDRGAWSIPKGEYVTGEQPLAAALREFKEETGLDLPDGEPSPLGETKLPSGKTITAWAIAGDCDAGAIQSNTFAMEWPPRSGKMQNFPEIDRAGWFTLEGARQKIHPAQGAFLDRLAQIKPPASTRDRSSDDSSSH